MPYLRLLRPHQWVKNVFVFAGLVFGHRLEDPRSVWLSLLGFALMCCVSSAIYVINDIRDREEDRLHPRKCRRPIASGQVSVGAASIIAAVLLLGGLGASALLSRSFFCVVVGYVVLQFLYNWSFKHAVILDVVTIGLGFVLRAVAGGFLIDVKISPWLMLCTFTLCLFMGFSKRRCELSAMAGNGGSAGKHRKTLALYTPDLLNHMTTLTAGVAIMSFMLYTIDKQVEAPFEKQHLVYTVPIVVYAVFRYAVLVEHGLVDGPTDVVLKDRPFQAAIGLWVVAAYLVVYQSPAVKDVWSRLTGS